MIAQTTHVLRRQRGLPSSPRIVAGPCVDRSRMSPHLASLLSAETQRPNLGAKRSQRKLPTVSPTGNSLDQFEQASQQAYPCSQFIHLLEGFTRSLATSFTLRGGRGFQLRSAGGKSHFQLVPICRSTSFSRSYFIGIDLGELESWRFKVRRSRLSRLWSCGARSLRPRYLRAAGSRLGSGSSPSIVIEGSSCPGPRRGDSSSRSEYRLHWFHWSVCRRHLVGWCCCLLKR